MEQIDLSEEQYGETKLGAAWKAINEGSTKGGTTYDALKVPADTGERQALCLRLMEMFSRSVSTGFKGTPAELVAILENVSKTMPDPAKYPKEFADFVQGRCHGVLEMLRLLVSYMGKDPEAADVVRQTKALSAPARVDGMPKALNNLKPGVRNDVMHERVEGVRELQKLWAFIKPSNLELRPQVQEKLQAELFDVLDAIDTVFTEKAPVFTQKARTPEFHESQWYNQLLKKLLALDISDLEAARAKLETFVQAMRDAADAKAFTGAIEALGVTVH